MAFLVASPLWLSAVPPSVGSTFRTSFAQAALPLLEGVRATGEAFTEILFGIINGPFLLHENRLLKSQLAAAGAHEQVHQSLFEENARLRKLLQFKEQSPWRLVSAHVIYRDVGLWARTLLINKGKRNGVRSGMAVVTPGGLAGRVTDTGDDSARMILLADPHFRLSATVSRSRVSGLIMGTASGDCLLTYLPLHADVRPGDTVETSGDLSFCPGVFRGGVVESVATDSPRLYRVCRLKTAVSLGAIEEVAVVVWPQSDSSLSS